MTFISEQYVPSICPEPAAPELREQGVSAGALYLSSVFYKQGMQHFKIKYDALFPLSRCEDWINIYSGFMLSVLTVYSAVEALEELGEKNSCI